MCQKFGNNFIIPKEHFCPLEFSPISPEESSLVAIVVPYPINFVPTRWGKLGGLPGFIMFNSPT